MAHNSHGFSRLLQRLSLTYPNHEYRFVIGFSKGNDLSECARLLEEKAHAVHLAGGSHPRLAQASEIQTSFANPEIETSIGQDIQNALNASNPKQEVIVIAGSFLLWLMQEKPPASQLSKIATKGCTPYAREVIFEIYR